MKIVVQRTKNASVKVDGNIIGEINKGYVLFIGFTLDDNEELLDKMADKVVNLRIFEDDNEKMNYDIKDVNGSILSISQFTLYAKLDGRRPSFSNAMKYNEAKRLYELFNKKLKERNINVQTGEFGSDMKVELLNDGPVTIIIDSNE